MKNDFTFKNAQEDMCTGYAFGAIGILTSGIMWLMSAFVAHYYSPTHAIVSLLIGGALISPVSRIMGKIIGLQGHHTDNPLKHLAMENTFWMLMCIPIAYIASIQNVHWFFQGMLLIIGGRYLTFATLFGKKMYWALGACLGIAAYFLFRFHQEAFITLLTGALLEILFGIIMYLSYRKIVPSF